MSLTPEFNGSGSGSLLDSILSLASRHPGLAINILYSIHTVLYTVLYSKVHKTTTARRGSAHTTMYARHVN